MILVRELIYKEKTLDEFEIDDENSLFYFFFEYLIGMREIKSHTTDDVEKLITNIFNDASFICTVVYQLKRPSLHYGYIRSMITRKSGDKFYSVYEDLHTVFVLSIAYILLEVFFSGKVEISRFKKLLSDEIDQNSLGKINFSSFVEAYTTDFNGNNGSSLFRSGFFVCPPLTPDRLKMICWAEISNNYDKKCLKDIVGFWTNPRDRNIIIDDIKAEIKSIIANSIPW